MAWWHLVGEDGLDLQPIDGYAQLLGQVVQEFLFELRSLLRTFLAGMLVQGTTSNSEFYGLFCKCAKTLRDSAASDDSASCDRR